MSPAAPPKSWSGRIARGIGRGLAWLSLGLAALLCAGLLSINLPPVSHFLAGKLEGVLANSFRGRLVFHRLGHLGLSGVWGAEIEVLDPAGHSVARAQGIDVVLAVPRLAYDALFRRGPLRLGIASVSVARLGVTLIDDGSGAPTLLRAFEPKQPAPQRTPAERSAPLELSVSQLSIARTELRGSLATPGPIDVDLNALGARFSSGARGLDLRLEQVALEARELPMVQHVSGKISAEVHLPASSAAPAAASPSNSGQTTQALALRETRRVDLTFDADVAGSGVLLEAHLTGDELRARLEAEAVSRATLRAIAPGLNPKQPLGISVTATGPLDALALEARLKSAAARATLHVQASRHGSGTGLRARLDAAEIDLSQFSSQAPVTRLAFDANGELDAGADGMRGSYRLHSADSRVAKREVPELTLSGEFESPKSRAVQAQGTLELNEPRAPVRVQYEVERGAEIRAKVHATAELDRPRRLRALTGLSVVGGLAANLRFDGASQLLDADLGIHLHDLRHRAFTLRQIDAAVVARGSIEEPELRGSFDASDVQGAGRMFPRVWARAQGTPAQLNVQAHLTGRHPDQIDLHALIVPGSERLVRAPIVLVQDGLSNASITAESISVAPRLRVQGLQLTGPGRARLSFAYGRQLEELALETKDLDVARLLSMFGVVTPLHAAKANLEARLSHQGRALSGKLAGRICDVAFADLQGSAHADLTLQQDRLDGTLGVSVPNAGTSELRFEHVTAPLAAPSQRDLEQLTGNISMQGQLQLERLSTLLPFVGLERGRGQLRYRLELGRETPGRELPSWKAHIETRNLELVGQRQSTSGDSDPDQARHAAPWSLRGVDLNVDAALDHHVAEVHGKLLDRDGDLARLQASLRDLDQVRDWRRPTESLLGVPFAASLEVPARPLEHLPELIRPAGLSGKLALDLKANGTLRDPQLQGHAKLQGFGPGELENRQLVRLDWDLSADYAQTGGHLAARAERAQRALLNLDAEWTGDARQLAAGVEGPSPVVARLALDLHDFPVHAVPALELRHVQGALSGSAHVDGLGKDARLAIDLESRDLSVSRSLVGHLQTKLQGGAEALRLQADIHGPAGDLSASLDAPWEWGNRLLPSPAGQVQGDLQTRGFQLSTLLPLVEGSISELAGQLDSHFSATFQGDQTRLSGQATLAQGAVNLPNLGQRFSDMSAKITLTQQELRVEELRARGVSGAFDGKASVQLDHLVPTLADASLHIKEKEKLPITVQGETMGEVWGSIDAHYQRDPARAVQSIQVDLQKLNIELPEANPRSLASLDQPSYIRVGYIRQDDQFAAINLQPIEKPSEPSDQKTLVTVNLNSVTVQKGEQVRVVLGGKLNAQLAPELSVHGTIEAKRGQLFISGKSFDIERATVAFSGGKPDDPTISALARYDAPAGYTVYAEYVGTVKKGKLTLRADPSLTQDEIVTLLLFGSPDGSIGAGNGDSLSTAVSVAGGAAAQGLNRAISDVTNLDVSARVDTSTGSPRPELVLQVTPSVAAEVTQALGEPAPGESPDRTFVTIDLRLASTWSISTTVGDRGSSALDLIWRKRY